MAKLIHSSTLAAFKTAFPNWSQKTGNDAYSSIAFTDDGYLCTHGLVFKIALDSITNPYNLALTAENNTLSVSVGGYADTLSLIGTSPITVTGTDSSITISHNTSLSQALSGIGSYTAPTITLPSISVDTYGHVTGLTSSTVNINIVGQTSDTTTTSNKYLLFGGTNNSETNFNSNIYVIPSTGVLSATTLQEGGTSISSKYAVKDHASSATTYGLGTESLYGHVKLSDSYNSTNKVSSGIGVTPYAVYQAYLDAVAAAKQLLSSNDAMQFVGTLSNTGVIKTYNSGVITQAITTGTTNISALTSYSAGWSWKVDDTTAGTISGIGEVEPGDMVICVKDITSGTYSASDWTIIQGNITGAVTTGSNATVLTENQLVVGAGSHLAKTLAAGSDSYILKMSGGVPTWSAITWRPISINSTSFLEDNATALNLIAGNHISLTTGTNGAVTLATTGLLATSDVLALTINSSSNSVSGTYNPSSTAATLTVGGGLTLSSSSSTYTISHNTYTNRASGAYKITVDSYGHVSAVSALSSLSILNNSAASVAAFNGGSDLSLKFVNGTDISLLPTLSSGVVTITPSITHRYRAISFIGTSGTTTATSIYGETTSGTLTLKAGDNISMTNASGILTINSSYTNTWRDVKAYDTSTRTQSSIGTSILSFGEGLGWSSNTLDIVWAEVDSTGAITYTL